MNAYFFNRKVEVGDAHILIEVGAIMIMPIVFYGCALKGTARSSYFAMRS